jgi:16S rRNA (guanine527-N7)-methyltransferase
MNNIFSTHGFELSTTEIERFSRLLTLFQEYNTHTNLSAIRDEEGIIEKHFIDSLYGAVFLQETASDEPKRLLDIGSGWGFPWIPLKIVMPHLRVTLLDSVGKKVKAMNHFVQELGLENIQAIQERAEILAKNPEHSWQYDYITSRATAYITDILTWAVPFLAPGGRIILYKMPSDEEIKDREKISKKLWLKLIEEFSYELGWKERILSIFEKRK